MVMSFNKTNRYLVDHLFSTEKNDSYAVSPTAWYDWHQPKNEHLCKLLIKRRGFCK